LSSLQLFSRHRAVNMFRGRRKWLVGVCDWSPAAATQGSSDAAGAPLIGADRRRSPQGRGRRHGCGLLASSRTASGIASWRTNGCCPRRRLRHPWPSLRGNRRSARRRRPEFDVRQSSVFVSSIDNESVAISKSCDDQYATVSSTVNNRT